MNNDVHMDHIEVHVAEIVEYGDFLQKLFGGGRFKRISDSGTSMFISPEGLCIEVKKRQITDVPTRSGFCLPCLRMEGGRAHIESTLSLVIDETITNPEGEVHFFTDSEGVEWHIKDYSHRDRYINW
jgi:hypothetical protein